MTLLEVVVSSVVLAGSSSAALGVWNQSATELQRASFGCVVSSVGDSADLD